MTPTRLLSALVLLTMAATGCASSPDQGPVVSCSSTPVSTFADLHGLAVNPQDSSVLFAATHHGLIRAVNDTGWARVGDSQDDLMGFSPHPTKGSVLFSSGHPGGGFGSLGFRRSVDGGCTWQRLGMEGADLHAMTVSGAEAKQAWGFYAGKLYRSVDGGVRWDVVASASPSFLSLAGDPMQPSTVYGAAGQQGLLRSLDGGATWSQVLASPVAGVAVAQESGSRNGSQNGSALFAGGQGTLKRSTDGGVTWVDLPLGAPADAVLAYIAVGPGDSRVVYAGSYQTGIYKSSDAGNTWSAVKAPSK